MVDHCGFPTLHVLGLNSSSSLQPHTHARPAQKSLSKPAGNQRRNVMGEKQGDIARPPASCAPQSAGGEAPKDAEVRLNHKLITLTQNEPEGFLSGLAQFTRFGCIMSSAMASTNSSRGKCFSYIIKLISLAMLYNSSVNVG